MYYRYGALIQWLWISIHDYNEFKFWHKLPVDYFSIPICYKKCIVALKAKIETKPLTIYFFIFIFRLAENIYMRGLKK